MNPALPTEVDFDPWGGDLDAQWAWKNFGGLTLDAAKEKFSQKPECYHEDFMSMGSRAFSFYFPVIETHILDAPIDYEGWDRCAWIALVPVGTEISIHFWRRQEASTYSFRAKLEGRLRPP